MALLRRLAVLSLLALGGLGCSAGGAQTESDERSPHGLYALRRLLSEQGAKVHQRVEPLAKIGDDVGLIVLYATELEEPAHQRVLEWVKRGGSLVVVESHAFTQDAALEPRISRCKGKPTRGPGIELPALDLSVPGNHTFALRENQDEFLAQRVDLTCDAQPYVVTTFLGDGSITFIPDRELLWNASLSRGDNARLVAELLAAPEQTIELVGPWTGDGSQSPVQSLKAAGLSPVMLHLFALALLVAVRQGTSFGARREVTRHDRRAFSDHVRALASTYARANAEQLAGSHYGAFLIDQLRERTCPGQHPTLLQLAAAIARRVERPEGAVVQLLVEAKSAFDEAGAGDQGMNRKLISELEQLSLQAGGIS